MILLKQHTLKVFQNLNTFPQSILYNHMIFFDFCFFRFSCESYMSQRVTALTILNETFQPITYNLFELWRMLGFQNKDQNMKGI